MRNRRWLHAITCAVLWGLAAPGTPAATDARLSRLGSEVHRKGWIVYSALTVHGDWDLFLMRPDGSERRNISGTPEFNEMGGRFSPDGKTLLYRRISKQTKINHDVWGAMGELVVANADGTGSMVYGQAGEFPWASWSPDGKQLACLSRDPVFQPRTALLAATRFFSLRENGVYPYADFEF